MTTILFPRKRFPAGALAVKCVALFALGALVLPTQAAERFDIAITVDDLPVHGLLPPGMTRLGIAQSTLATLKAHGVPEAFGFVNASRIAQAPDGAAVLDAWRAAGHPLGNHTNTHMNLARSASLAPWRDDLVAGEAAVESRMAGADWRYLRFPHLAAGKHLEEALDFVGARGYRVADVSLSFDDWAYTDAHARCATRGDDATIAAMKRQYLDDVERALARMATNSRRVFGRVIPQVLLTHLGGWSALTLPDVMARLDAAGARYVTLAQAQSDPSYARPGGGTLIERVARQRGVALTSDRAAPAPPRLDPATLCL
jgi:peptidoglycan/xylan/chitin deacetylase (PgdA/CDA1 family)